MNTYQQEMIAFGLAVAHAIPWVAGVALLLGIFGALWQAYQEGRRG